jgi:hypothetical protein
VCCGARATCMAEDTVHGSSVDGVCVPLDRYTSKHLPQRLKFVLRNTLRTSCFAWNAPAGLHTLQVPVHRTRSYIPREHAARARCKRSHTEPLRCVPGNSRGKIAKRADCWLRSTAQVHWSPFVPVQAVTARCVGRNSQNRGQCACFAAVGWDGASWAQLSHHSTLAYARAPPSHPTVMCRVPPSGDTP